MSAPGVERDAAWWAGFCEVMEMTRSSCAHCRGIPDLPPSDEPRDPPGNAPAISYPFTVRYPGRCRECGGSVQPGDEARMVEGFLVCEECTPWLV